MEDQLHCVSHTVRLDIFTVYFKEGKETTVITGMLSVAIMKLVIILLMSWNHCCNTNCFYVFFWCLCWSICVKCLFFFLSFWCYRQELMWSWVNVRCIYGFCHWFTVFSGWGCTRHLLIRNRVSLLSRTVSWLAHMKFMASFIESNRALCDAPIN